MVLISIICHVVGGLDRNHHILTEPNKKRLSLSIQLQIKQAKTASDIHWYQLNPGPVQITINKWIC